MANTDNHDHDDSIASLLAAGTVDELLDASAEAASEVLDARACHVIGIEDGELDVLASTDEQLSVHDDIPVATDIIGQFDLIGRSHVFDDICDVRSTAVASADASTAGEPRSLLVAPIDAVGLLVATDPVPAAFDDADRQWAEQLAGYLDQLFEDDSMSDDALAPPRLERIATTLAHDFAGPLTVARGSIELAEETGDDKHFDRASKAIDRIEQLVNGIERMARSDGEFPREQVVELRPIIQSIWPTINHEGTTIEIVESRSLLADEHALAQLVTNLLTNAVDHGAAGGTIRVGTIEDGFFIEDDGPGIDPADRERIFEWGHSGGGEHKGIGLSIAKQIADVHGWSIDVTDGRDGGARFEITGVDGP